MCVSNISTFSFHLVTFDLRGLLPQHARWLRPHGDGGGVPVTPSASWHIGMTQAVPNPCGGPPLSHAPPHPPVNDSVFSGWAWERHTRFPMGKMEGEMGWGGGGDDRPLN